MLTIELNMYHAVALGAFLFWLGGIITDKISLLNRYCIPAPLVGGLCFSILNCILSKHSESTLIIRIGEF